MVLRPALTITAKALWAGYIKPRTAVRMLALATLAKLAHEEGGAMGMTYKMHIGAMRGAFRRDVVAYRNANVGV